MDRDMLCYCLNLTYEDIRRLWEEGYFAKKTDYQPGMYCTSCRGDLAWFIDQLTGSPQRESQEAGGRAVRSS